MEMDCEVEDTGQVGDGAMATVDYRIAHGRGVQTADAWQAGVELESSVGQQKTITFEVGSRMVLPLLDHAVRRLSVGQETGTRMIVCLPACANEGVVHVVSSSHAAQSQSRA